MINVGTKGHCDHEESTLNLGKSVGSICGVGGAVATYLRASEETKTLVVNDNSKFIQQKMQGKRRVY